MQLGHFPVRWVAQSEPLGTAHAVLQTLPLISDGDQVLILYGDVPLITATTLRAFVDQTPPENLGLLTAILPDPYGYGRIDRDQQKQIRAVIEDKDTNAITAQICEINSGIYVMPAHFIKTNLSKLTTKNAQQEYYLTDLIHLAYRQNIAIHGTVLQRYEEIQGVNDRLQLAHLERLYQLRLANQLMQQGVTLYDPNRFDIRGEAKIGQDVTIDVNVILEGRVIIGNHCYIGPGVYLRHTVIGDHVEIKANSVIDGAEIGSHAVVGPFARLRPGTVLDLGVHIGNFVEVKNSEVGANSKVNHLSYIGDSEIGKRVNIGAGTITCNYDGMNKYKTIIEDETHIGSDTQLVAPVKIGKGATIGAGSTITKDVVPDQLTVTHRLDQRIIPAWERPGMANRQPDEDELN